MRCHWPRMTAYLRRNAFFNPKLLLVAQASIVLFCMAFLLLAPTQTRPMMFVPLSSNGQSEVASLATAGDRKLLGPGPVAGSLVVRGSPQNPISALLNRGVLIVAVSYSSCANGRK